MVWCHPMQTRGTQQTAEQVNTAPDTPQKAGSGV